MTRMFHANRFTTDQGSSFDWDGPADGNLFAEGLPCAVKDAVERGEVVTDHFENTTYRKVGNDVVVTMLPEA